MKLEYLPYHFLLISASRAGYLKYLDYSIGKLVVEIRTRRGPPMCLRQNKQNAVVVAGHSTGEITMWTPNMGSKPVARMLAHPSAPVTSVSISPDGKYMATTGKDAHMKIWDIRSTYKCVYDYFNPTPAHASDFSDSGLLSVAIGNEVQIWKNSATEKQKMPYMKHKVAGGVVSALKFVPFEDVLAIGHATGYSSIVVPGSGEANFDAFENNPFEQTKQM